MPQGLRPNRNAAVGSVPLAGRVAIVTGAGGGIGAAVCAALAEGGAHVVAAGRSAGALEAVVAATAAAGRPAVAMPDTDVRAEASMAAMAAETLRRFGRIDALVTAAGAPRDALPYPVAALRTEAWDEVIDVNLKGVFLASRAVLPAMMRQRSGQIVHIASARGSLGGRPHAAAYCASKFGVMGLSESLAEEAAGFGIRVHVVLPDAVDTPLIAGTRLAPRGALPPERVGRFVADLLRLPPDATIVHPLLAPFDHRGAVA